MARDISLTAIPDINERRQAVLEELKTILEGMGYQPEIVARASSWDPPTLRVGLFHLQQSTYTPYSWEKGKVATMRFKVGGSWPDKQVQFPEPKAGFNLEKIALCIQATVQNQIKRDEANAEYKRRDKEGEAAVKRINDRYGTQEAPRLAYVRWRYRAGIQLETIPELTEDQADRLLASALEILSD